MNTPQMDLPLGWYTTAN